MFMLPLGNAFNQPVLPLHSYVQNVKGIKPFLYNRVTVFLLSPVTLPEINIGR